MPFCYLNCSHFAKKSNTYFYQIINVGNNNNHRHSVVVVTIPESFSFAFEDPVFSICCSLVNFAIYTFTPKEQKQTVTIIYGTKWSWGAWIKKGKGSSYSVTKHRVPELILVLGSQPAGDVSHKPGSRLPLLSARPAVTPTTFTRAATNFAVWWTEARWVWTVS